ncbi:uncharacterized protein LOC134831109 [Culicoides brevitarsis]|uniref:uncharacterized protein LOC134831109 n=1 Tax=Culicoides brevitarsis TaxID=469753 RepID=UPI00307B628E
MMDFETRVQELNKYVPILDGFIAKLEEDPTKAYHIQSIRNVKCLITEQLLTESNISKCEAVLRKLDQMHKKELLDQELQERTESLMTRYLPFLENCIQKLEKCEVSVKTASHLATIRKLKELLEGRRLTHDNIDICEQSLQKLDEKVEKNTIDRIRARIESEDDVNSENTEEHDDLVKKAKIIPFDDNVLIDITNGDDRLNVLAFTQDPRKKNKAYIERRNAPNKTYLLEMIVPYSENRLALRFNPTKRVENMQQEVTTTIQPMDHVMQRRSSAFDNVSLTFMNATMSYSTVSTSSMNGTVNTMPQMVPPPQAQNNICANIVQKLCGEFNALQQPPATVLPPTFGNPISYNNSVWDNARIANMQQQQIPNAIMPDSTTPNFSNSDPRLNRQTKSQLYDPITAFEPPNSNNFDDQYKDRYSRDYDRDRNSRDRDRNARDFDRKRHASRDRRPPSPKYDDFRGNRSKSPEYRSNNRHRDDFRSNKNSYDRNSKDRRSHEKDRSRSKSFSRDTQRSKTPDDDEECWDNLVPPLSSDTSSLASERSSVSTNVSRDLPKYDRNRDSRSSSTQISDRDYHAKRNEFHRDSRDSRSTRDSRSSSVQLSENSRNDEKTQKKQESDDEENWDDLVAPLPRKSSESVEAIKPPNEPEKSNSEKSCSLVDYKSSTESEKSNKPTPINPKTSVSLKNSEAKKPLESKNKDSSSHRTRSPSKDSKISKEGPKRILYMARKSMDNLKTVQKPDQSNKISTNRLSSDSIKSTASTSSFKIPKISDRISHDGSVKKKKQEKPVEEPPKGSLKQKDFAAELSKLDEPRQKPKKEEKRKQEEKSKQEEKTKKDSEVDKDSLLEQLSKVYGAEKLDKIKAILEAEEKSKTEKNKKKKRVRTLSSDDEEEEEESNKKRPKVDKIKTEPPELDEYQPESAQPSKKKERSSKSISESHSQPKKKSSTSSEIDPATKKIKKEPIDEPVEKEKNHQKFKLIEISPERFPEPSKSSAKKPKKKSELAKIETPVEENRVKYIEISPERLPEPPKSSPNKPKKKRLSELAKLNEDINSMFIRDAVLQATGRRQLKSKEAFEEEIYGIKVQKCSVRLTRCDALVKKYQNSPKIMKKSNARVTKQSPKKQKKVTQPVNEAQSDEDEGDHYELIDENVRNIDKNYHFRSEPMKCLICTFEGVEIVEHYLKMHPKKGVFISRFPPEKAQLVKDNPIAKNTEPFDKNKSRSTKLTASCSFCLKNLTLDRRNWKMHFMKHTGEFQCKNCKVSDAHPVDTKTYITKFPHAGSCKGTKIFTIDAIQFHGEGLDAFMCPDCHFVQLLEGNMRQHFKFEHANSKNVQPIRFLIIGFRFLNDEHETSVDDTTDTLSEEETAVPLEHGYAQNTTTTIENTEPEEVNYEKVVVKEEPSTSTTSPSINNDTKNAFSLTINPKNRMKVWSPNPSAKFPANIDRMLKPDCLYAFYKCMHPMCSFFTSTKTSMEYHLETHGLDQNQAIECCYCDDFRNGMPSYFAHMETQHLSNIYQCAYCFYRSVAAFNVFIHESHYHREEPKKILICAGTPQVLQGQLDNIYVNRTKYVPQLKCSVCLYSTYIQDDFMKHLRSHPDPDIKCQSCTTMVPKGFMLKHLLTHRIGLYECNYCFYGTMSLDSIRLHMSTVHPTKLLYVTARLKRNSSLKTLDITKLASTVLAHIGENVDPAVIVTQENSLVSQPKVVPEVTNVPKISSIVSFGEAKMSSNTIKVVNPVKLGVQKPSKTLQISPNAKLILTNAATYKPGTKVIFKQVAAKPISPTVKVINMADGKFVRLDGASLKPMTSLLKPPSRPNISVMPSTSVVEEDFDISTIQEIKEEVNLGATLLDDDELM